jgi:hypothetical protein
MLNQVQHDALSLFSSFAALTVMPAPRRHAREGEHPVFRAAFWILACARVTIVRSSFAGSTGVEMDSVEVGEWRE